MITTRLELTGFKVAIDGEVTVKKITVFPGESITIEISVSTSSNPEGIRQRSIVREGSDNYNTYFSEAVLNRENANIVSQAYVYLQAVQGLD